MDSRFDPPQTIADLEAIPYDGKRYELIEGQLYVSDSACYTHQTVLWNVALAVCEYLRSHPIGEIVPGIGVVLDDFNSVIPDLLFFTNERKSRILAGRWLIAAPDIAVEILSPGASDQRRDRQIKRNLYSATASGSTGSSLRKPAAWRYTGSSTKRALCSPRTFGSAMNSALLSSRASTSQSKRSLNAG